MQPGDEMKRPLLKYFILTYLIFLLLFGITGAMFAINAPSIAPNVMQVICAWAPTFAFLILFRKLMPGLSLKDYLKRQFSSKVNLADILYIIGIQLLALFGILALVSIVNKTPLTAAINSSASVIVLGFFNMLIRGPLGEELGWRGYALNQLQKTRSPLTSSLIIGLVWGFWHTPLWIVTSGYTGIQLLAYAAVFLMGIITASIIMTYFYNRSKNLLIPILIHQLLNYLGSFVNADSFQVLLYQSAGYLVIAILLILFNPKRFIVKPI